MICSACNEELATEVEVCSGCGESPLLDGRYRLDSAVGHGANGTTYRATRLEDGAVVAIKELLVRKVESLKAIELFEREARVLRELVHEGVPRYLDELTSDGRKSISLYLVQEFIEGQTLEEEFGEARQTPEAVFQIAAELLDTLDHMHRLSPPVVHRDIKPANIMRREDGSLVLIDFGSVREALDVSGGSTVAGTYGYMAPEQFAGKASAASDIYAVGATVVGLLTRSDPSSLQTSQHVIEWRDAVDVEPAFGALLERMLEPDPEVRESDAGKLALDIRNTLSGIDVEPATPRAEPTTSPSTELSRDRLPDDFAKVYAAEGADNRYLGQVMLGTGIACGLGAVIAGVALGLGQLMVMAIAIVGMMALLGLPLLLRARRRLHAASTAYLHGEEVRARITAARRNMGTSGQRIAQVYEYEFEAAGRRVEGKHFTNDELDLLVGDEVTVLSLADKPEWNVLAEPQQYRYRRDRGQSATTLSFPESEEATEESVDREVKQKR